MKFIAPLEVRRIDGKVGWEVLCPFILDLGNPKHEQVIVHKGFLTDFASIPFPMSRIFLPVGKSYDKASVIHDLLYWLPVVWGEDGSSRTIKRDEADRIYLNAMAESGTPSCTRQSIYLGVRAGGWRPWNKYRSEDHTKLDQSNGLDGDKKDGDVDR